MPGINRADPKRRSLFEFSEIKAIGRPVAPCIFLSHKSEDKKAAVTIGDYIMDYENIDIYLDIYDALLQKAVVENDPAAITKNIENGISESSHVMCICSENTADSWWVPYELGYGKSKGAELALLKLKGKVKLPEYLQIVSHIRGQNSLDKYLLNISKKGFVSRAGSVALGLRRFLLCEYLEVNE